LTTDAAPAPDTIDAEQAALDRLLDADLVWISVPGTTTQIGFAGDVPIYALYVEPAGLPAYPGDSGVRFIVLGRQGISYPPSVAEAETEAARILREVQEQMKEPDPTARLLQALLG
jgi:hypothetical protein